MSTSSPFRTLLTQFQSRYPMGSLSSDLLTIYQEQYVVRSVAQLGGTVLATGMASASDIETAEDRSKIRALEALGLGIAGTGISPSAAFPNALLTPPLPSSEQPVLADNAPSVPLQPSKDRFSPPELETDIISASVSLPKAGGKPATSPKTSSQTPIAPVESSMPASATLPNSGFANPEDEPITGSSTAFNSIHSSSSLSDRSEKDSSPVKESSIDEIDRFSFAADLPTADSSSFSAFDSSHSVDSTLASGTTALSSPSATKSSEKAGKSSKRKSSETFELPPTPTPSRQPSDRSEEIMKIGIEMKRLGWSTEQGREYLKRTYGKRSRQELDDAELLDFLRYLETQPASVQAPF